MKAVLLLFALVVVGLVCQACVPDGLLLGI